MSEIKNETISIELHEKIIDDLKIQHRYMYDSMKDQNWRIIKWLLCIIAALIIIFAGYVFYQSQYETIVIEQDAQTDSGTALLNGTGELRFNGDKNPSENSDTGEESKQEQPDQNMPEM